MVKEEEEYPGFGYPTMVAMGFIITAFSLLPIIWSWYFEPLRVMGIIWLAIIWGITASGCWARYREKRNV